MIDLEPSARGSSAIAFATICWLHERVDSGPPVVTNEQIAALLERVAERLETQHANMYRIDAYRAGAAVVRDHPSSIQDLALTEGREGLDALPQIGKSLSGSIDEIAHTGKLRMLGRLEGSLSAVELFKTVPGIGEELAERIHRELDIDTLESLEVAAHDGRLDAVAGFGPRRLEAIRDILATMLTRSARGRARRFEDLKKREPRSPLPRPPKPNQMSPCCSRSIEITGRKPKRASSLASRLSETTPMAPPGCPSFTATKTAGTSPRFTPTPTGPTSSAAFGTGW